jgi:hypothetical protein
MTYPLPTGPGAPLAHVDGKPLYPYAAPFVRHVGRFLDSVFVADYQRQPRTLRANGITVAGDVAFGRIGAHFVRWNDFFGSLGKPLSSQIISSGTRPGDRERYLPWNRHAYPEAGGGWHTYLWDGQDRLYGFDFDDRGNVYLAYVPWGAGICDAETLGLVHQLRDATGEVIGVFRSSGRYYMMMSYYHTSELWDVTHPTATVLVRSGISGAHGIAVIQGATDAWVAMGGASWFGIWSGYAVVSGTPPVWYVTSDFRSVTTDGASFYMLRNTSLDAVISRITPDNGPVQSVTLPGVTGRAIRYGSGHLTVTGVGSDKLRDVWLLRASDLKPIDLGPFIKRHYFQQGDYAVPQAYASSADNVDALYHQRGGREYLILSFRNLGDVWEIDTGAEVVTPPPPPSPPPDPEPSPTDHPQPDPDPEPPEEDEAVIAELRRQIEALEARVDTLTRQSQIKDATIEQHMATIQQQAERIAELEALISEPDGPDEPGRRRVVRRP